MPTAASTTTSQIQGSCLCAWITFQISFPDDIQPHYPLQFTSAGKLRATNCHCSECRKFTGALHGTWAHIPSEFIKIRDLAMNMGSYRLSATSGRARKFCRVCGTSLFITPMGWDSPPASTEMTPENMFNREFEGNPGLTIDVSVGAMDVAHATEWVEITQHVFLNDSMDAKHAFSEPTLPK